MTFNRLGTSIGLLGLSLLLAVFMATNAQAIPAFARKNNVACSTCHSAWPLLNATGRSYKENGYRFARDEESQSVITDFLQLDGTIPIAALVKARPYDKKEGGDEKIRAIHEFEIFFAGQVAKNISMYIELEAEDELDFKPEMVGWVTWNASEMFNLTFAYDSMFVSDPFDTLSGARRLTRNRNAVIDNRFGGGDNNGRLRDARQVVSISGRPTERLFYAIGYIGNKGDAEGVNANTFNARLAFDIMDGLTVGGFGVWGKCETSAGNCDLDRNFSRYGLDAQAEFGNSVVHAAWVNAKDDNNALDLISGLQEEVSNNAFYVSGLYAFQNDGKPTFVPSIRFDFYEKSAGTKDYTDMTFNLGYYLTENVRLYGEYYKQLSVPVGEDKKGRFTMQVELAF